MPVSIKARTVSAAALLLLMLALALSSQRFVVAGDRPQSDDPTQSGSAHLYLPFVVKPFPNGQQSLPGSVRLYLPSVARPFASGQPLPPPIALTTAPPLDVQALVDSTPWPWQLGLTKIGFHAGPGGNRTGIGDWMRRLDAASVPLFIKSVDDAGPVYEAQEIMKASSLPHTLVYRTTTQGNLSDNYDYDVPNYDFSPGEAAFIHWQAHKAKFPPELDPRYVWLETINEVDQNRSEWLAEFALETGRLALQDGYRWAAFGWSSGEPEEEVWESPHMLAFLRFAAEHPNDIAIALHEYSYQVNSIGAGYPYLIGRFQALLDVCDKYDIPRPTILITEWGWTYQEVPGRAEALSDMHWANKLYAAYPNVKGAAMWYLGGGFGNIHNLTQALIAPVTDYSLSNYFWVASGQGPIDHTLFPPPLPRPDSLELPEIETARLKGVNLARPAALVPIR